jgi:hypothetical protein
MCQETYTRESGRLDDDPRASLRAALEKPKDLEDPDPSPVILGRMAQKQIVGRWASLAFPKKAAEGSEIR